VGARRLPVALVAGCDVAVFTAGVLPTRQLVIVTYHVSATDK
jgi:hypothetical protein